MYNLLPIVAAADNFPPHSGTYPSFHPGKSGEKYIAFHLTFSDFQHDLPPLGLLRPSVVEELIAERESNENSPWQFHQIGQDPTGESEDAMDTDELDLQVECVFFADWVVKEGREGMERVMEETVVKWRKEGKFPGPLGGWRNEKYMIYCSPASSALTNVDARTSFSNAAFPLERSACAIFGFATFGVHMTAYEGEGEEMKIWVPRRSATKATWPSKLDNTVAGGIPAGMKPLDSMIKECDEEASFPEHFVLPRLKSTGVTTYFYITEDGYLQPELEYTYDLQLPPRDSPEYRRPKPHDDEVESFALMDIPEVLRHMQAGEFKPNCGLILVDFLMRHGIITPENEKNFLELKWRMTRRLGVAIPA